MILSFLAFATLLWAGVGIITAEAAQRHTEGTVVLDGGTVWYIGASEKRGFRTANEFLSHGYSFAGLPAATDGDRALATGSAMMFADGTLVNDGGTVYMVNEGTKRGFTSASVFLGLGFSFANLMTGSTADFSTGAVIDSATAAHPAGSLVLDGGTVWYVRSNGKAGVPSMDVFNSHGWQFSHVVAANASDVALATLANAAARNNGGSLVDDGTVVPPVSTGAVTVSAATQPASGTIIADTVSGDGAQALIDMLNVNFMAGSSAATVTTVKVKRFGVSANTDVSNVYLYEGSVRLAEMTSYSDGVATFTNAAGLFTVSANSTKTVMVKMDLANGTTAGKTIGLMVNAAADVVLGGGATVGGSFPVSGNTMTTAQVSDLGKLTINALTTYPASVDPGDLNEEVWRFNLVSADQAISVSKINLTMVGTISATDLQNIMLKYNGVQVGATMQIGANNEVLFDLSGAPITLTSGQTKTVTVHADIVGGTGRSFKFTIRKSSDIAAKDTNYNIWLKPNQTDTLSILEPTTGSGTSISTGSLTVGKASDSPSGNVALNADGQTLAKFSFTAAGEAVKVTTIIVESVVTVSADDRGLDNGKLYVDGVQVGSTADLDYDNTDDTNFTDSDTAITSATDDDTSFALGNTFVVPAGQTKTLTVVADTQLDDGTTLTANSIVRVSVGGIVATGQVSLNTLTVGTADGNPLTAISGALTHAENTAMADATTTNPTGVAGATNVKVASFVLTAGAGEAVSFTQVVVGDDDDDNTEDFGDNFQNLRLVTSGGTQIGSTQGTLSATAGADFTFNASPAIVINAGQQLVIDAYADILSSAAGFLAAAPAPGLEFVSASATGVSTGNSASIAATDTDLQNLIIATSGSLVITANSSTPAAGQLVMGETEQTVAILDFAAGSAEDVNVSTIIVTDTSSFAGSLGNAKLYVDGAQIGSTVTAFSADSNGTATFNLTTPWTITKGATKSLTVKVTVNAYPNAVSGSTHTVNIANAAAVTTTGVGSGQPIVETVTSATGTAQDVYRTESTVAKGASSPSGSATAGAGSTVLEFTVTANSAFDAVVNAVALTVSGTVDTTSNGNALLYKSTDLSTALATEAYVTATAAEENGVVDHSTTEFVAGVGDFDGIPVGANIRLVDGGTAVAGSFEVTAISAAAGTGAAYQTLTFTPAHTASIADGDLLYYRPMQPGTGRLYFGAQTTLTADLADTDTTATVTSTDGFATGDTLAVEGFDATGTAVTVASGCVVGSITSATALTVTACQLSADATIDFNYLSGTVANAKANNHNSAAIVRTGAVNETVSAGTPKTFVVKGDTTGATATETLRVDIGSAADINWDDKTSFGIITDTMTLPVTGGTLIY